MFGHEDIGSQAEGVLLFCGDDGVGEPLARAVARKEGLAAEAGEGEVVVVARGVVAAAAFAVGRVG